ncbi:MAG: ATP-dependent DNA helicase [Patescibacteria group bacterium]
MPNSLSDNLNIEQRQAVEYSDGSLLIVAGAGTGKTTVITQKIKHLIDKGLAKPEEILALTFNEKAAREMIERTDEILNIGYVDLQISTFHSFCQKILENYGLDIGLPNQFKILGQSDAWIIARDNLEKFNLDYYRPLGNPTRHVHELIKHFSKCKDELISPEDYLKHAENVKLDKDNADIDEKTRLTEISNAYHAYNQLLLENNALDFGDLIYYANKLLEKRPGILKKLTERYKFILVDEFQDVNWAQYSLVRLLAKNEITRITVVGDDDQSIYAFRGASVSNILRFKDDFPKTKEIVLTKNYRSQQEILDVAYKSIQNNNPDRLEIKLKINKKLSSTLENLKESVKYIHSTTLDAEVNAVVGEIINLKKKNKDAVWDDFAILTRANNHADPFVSALERRGIPYEFLAASGLYRQPIILDCLNFLKAVDNYHESSAIFRLLRLPTFEFSENDTQKFSFFAKKKSITYYEALKRAREIALSKNGIAVCEKIVNIIHDGMRAARQEKPTAVLYGFFEQSGYLKYLAKGEESGEREIIRQIHHLKQFFDYIADYEKITPDAKVGDFLEHFKFVMDSGDLGIIKQPEETPDSVNILTIHMAKGLEFKYVFIVNLVEERFPSRKRGEAIEIPSALVKEQLPEGDSHYQEERRLFYVALTRAKEKLYLAGADDYGGTRGKKASRFLAESGYVEENLGDKKSLKIVKTEKIISNFNSAGKAKSASEVKNDTTYEIPKVFSFSQIKSYEVCPYQYKLASVLKLPVCGNPMFSFGQTMHSVFQKFYERLLEVNSARQETLFNEPLKPSENKNIKAPELDELYKIYDECWICDWYADKKQRENYYAEGKKILREFYKTNDKKWSLPVALEGWFKIKIGQHLLRGRIDRVDQMPDGRLEIIDYKTGKSKEDIKGDDKNQLLIYQLAVSQLPEYKNIGEVGLLTYFYLNDNIKTSFLGEKKEIDKLEGKIIKTIEKIISRDFTPTPEKYACEKCDFKDICDYKA